MPASKTKNLKNARSMFLLFFLIALFLGISIIYFGYKPPKQESVKNKISNQAKMINDKCQKVRVIKTCLNGQFYILSKNTNLDFATNVLLSLQKLNPDASLGCHLIAHRITQAETEKNPGAWKQILKKVSPSMCTGGFLHGVLEVHERIDPSFSINDQTVTAICRDLLKDTWTGERSCYHNMGHLMLIQANADIHDAVNQCAKLTDSNSSYECLSGAFMENMTAENLLAHGLVKAQIPWTPTRAKEIENLCSEYQNLAAKACWREISYIYTTIDDQNPEKLYTDCQKAPEKPMSDECYVYGIGNIVNAPRVIKANTMDLCQPVATDNKLFDYCMRQVVWTLVTSSTDNIDRAVKLCEESPENYKSACAYNIINYLQMNKVSSVTVKSACDKIQSSIKPYLCTAYL